MMINEFGDSASTQASPTRSGMPASARWGGA
jgi:hypothetical protein